MWNVSYLNLSSYTVICISIFICIYLIILSSNSSENNSNRNSFKFLSYKSLQNEPGIFDNFDNKVGSDIFIVPNYIHFIHLGKVELDFVEAVCILAAAKNQKPDFIFIHTDVLLRGKYWDVVRKSIGKTLRLLKVVAPSKVFDKKLSVIWRRYHGADVLRLRILRTYGGIYLDSDTYLVRNIDHFRRYELTLGWKKGKSLQNQIIVAHKDARLLKIWLKGYEKDYKATSWYYNAGEFPTTILEANPHLVHSIPMLFGNYNTIRKIFLMKWPEWRNYYSIHLMVRHQYLLKNITNVAYYPVKFNYLNIHKFNITFREMVYDVYPYP